jgi:hypothetical protein
MSASTTIITRSKVASLRLPPAATTTTTATATAATTKKASSQKPCWVSATKTRNATIGDSVLDFFKIHLGITSSPPPLPKYDFKTFVMTQGEKFENGVYDILKKAFGDKFHLVETSFEADPQTVSAQSIKTLSLLRRGVPIIAQGYIRDEKSMLFGIPDLLVRGDYIKAIFKLFSPDYYFTGGGGDDDPDAPKICNTMHYVMDIKFSSLGISRTKHILASDSVNCFKAQIGIYNCILGAQPGFSRPRYAFIIGRRLRGLHSTESIGIGVIDFESEPDIYSNALYAVEEYRAIKNLSADQASAVMTEFYTPIVQLNMSNTSDEPWHAQKKQLALEKKDISLVWQCGRKLKRGMESVGITTWDDPRFIKFIRALVSPERYACMKNIIAVNTNAGVRTREMGFTANAIELKSKIKKVISDQFVFYVDFETVSDVNDGFDMLPAVHSTPPMIYMIGCGHLSPVTNKWVHSTFTASDLTLLHQTNIIKAWMGYMSNVANKRAYKVVHWGNAEVAFLKQAGYHNLFVEGCSNKNQFVDMCQIFQKEAFAIKGAFNYRLKDLARAFYNLGYISTKWDDNSGIDGLNAMVAVWKHNKDGNWTQNNTELKKIIKYNKIDCKVVYEMCNCILNT